MKKIPNQHLEDTRQAFTDANLDFEKDLDNCELRINKNNGDHFMKYGRQLVCIYSSGNFFWFGKPWLHLDRIIRDRKF